MSATSAKSFAQHVAQRQAAHEARSYGLPFPALGRQALEAAADVAVCCRAAARALERHDDLEPATREATADALRQAETFAAAAWRRLHGATEPPRAARAPHEHAGCCERRTWPHASAQDAPQGEG